MTLDLTIDPGDVGHIGDHEELHELAQRLDGQTSFLLTGVMQDTLANRPAAAAGNLGLLYFATDVPALYYSTGAAWAQSILSSTSNTFTAINQFDDDVFFGSGRPWVDVMHEGAVGDDATNDRQKIIDASTIVDGLGGGDVFYPPPPVAYLITGGNIPMLDRVNHVGPGSLIHQGTKTAAVFDFSGVDDIDIIGLELTHETAGTYDTGGTFPLITNSSASQRVRLFRVVLRDADKQAISVSDVVDWTLMACRFINIGRGAAVFTDSLDVLVIGCHFDSTGDDAIAFNGADSRGCIAEGNVIVDAGVLLDQGAGIKIHGPYCNAIGNTIRGAINGGIYLKMVNGGVYGTDGPTGNIIEGNTVDGMLDPSSGAPTQAGLRIEECHGVIRIEGNVVRSATGTVNRRGIRFETCQSATVMLVDNDFVMNAALAGATIVDLATSFALLRVAGCTFVGVSGSNAIRYTGTQATQGHLIIEDCTDLTANAGVWCQLTGTTTNGWASVTIANNRCPNLTGTFLQFGSVVVTELNTRNNRRGAATYSGGMSGVVAHYRNEARTLRCGSVTIADLATSAAVVFTGGAEPNTSYRLSFAVRVLTGAPAIFQPYASVETTTGFTLNVAAAPGAGTSVRVDWVLVRDDA